MRTKLLSLFSFTMLLLTAGCQDHRIVENNPAMLQVSNVATGLTAPLGLAMDDKGNLWVTEAGTGNNDGKVSMITPNGSVHTVIVGFHSTVSPENTPDGLNHLAYKDGKLYILHGVDEKMYIADVSNYLPGNPPMVVGNLQSEPIGQYVLDYNFPQDTQDSNLYNLTFGPDGDLYIADAGANAIIRRKKDGSLSVFATIPGVPNPTKPMLGPPVVQAVPTSINFDGQKFLVTTLTGFPFPAGSANIYQIDIVGNVSVFQSGFSTLVDLVLDPANQPVVLQVGQFGQQGFMPNSGGVIRAGIGPSSTLLGKLNMPTSLITGGAQTYYVSSLADGTVKRIKY